MASDGETFKWQVQNSSDSNQGCSAQSGPVRLLDTLAQACTVRLESVPSFRYKHATGFVVYNANMPLA